ncbi:MAG TPA: hypothetical protein VFW78_04925, partial [Bacteroidia bacterium]|nr:hypothetical protein [Bacteroidia bacterium]
SREWKGLGASLKVRNNRNLERLFLYLNSYYPDFKSFKIDQQSLYHAVFGTGPVDLKKIRYLFTDMQRAAEELIANSVLSNEPETRRRLLASELARRGAHKNYLSLYNKDAVTAGEDALPASERFFADFRREETHLLHYLSGQPRGETNILQTDRNLDLFYIVKKLQFLCEMTNIKNVLAVEYTSELQNEIIGALQNGLYADVPAVAAWYSVWLTLTAPENEKHFIQLQKILESSRRSFEQQELRDLYQYLMNFCIRRINTGDTLYVSTLLAIYKLLLRDGILLTDGLLSQWDYKNITAVGIRAEEVEWTRAFIENYFSILPRKDRQNAYTYNLAYYLFNTGNRSEALALLQKVEFKDLYYQLDARVILLKCYFEEGDEEAFFYHAAAFRLFIARNKQVSAYQKTVYRNLLRYSTKLLRANGDRKKTESLKKEIERVRNIADIGWLLRQFPVS